MNKTLALLAATAAVAFAAPVFAADTKMETSTKVKHEKDGDSKIVTKSEGTDAAGTDTETKTIDKVDAHADGSTTETVKTKKVVDPKGLMNKSKTTTETKVEKDAAGNVVSSKKEVDGKVVEENK